MRFVEQEHGDEGCLSSHQQGDDQLVGCDRCHRRSSEVSIKFSNIDGSNTIINNDNISRDSEDDNDDRNRNDCDPIERGNNDSSSSITRFIGNLRTLLLRARVAGQLRQDFVLSRQLVELKALCRGVCAELGTKAAVFEDLWAVVGRQGHLNIGAFQRLPTSCSWCCVGLSGVFPLLFYFYCVYCCCCYNIATCYFFGSTAARRST